MAVHHFNTLSTELMIFIFEHFDARTIVSGLETCKRWNTILKGSQFLYKVLCYQFGYADGSQDPEMPMSERLAALEARVSGFDKIPANFKPSIPLPDASDVAYSDGLIAVAQESMTKIIFYDVASSGTRQKWTIDVGIQVRKLYLDRYQDFLVVVENQQDNSPQRYHIRSIDTGASHPESSLDVLTIPDPYVDAHHNIVKFAGTYLAIGFLSVDHHTGQNINNLAIWNWKTGDLVLETTLPILQAFAFISFEHLLVENKRSVQRRRGSHVYMQLEACWLTVYSLKERREMTRFAFPSFHNGFFVASEILSGPFSIPNPPGLFYPSPYDGVTYIHMDTNKLQPSLNYHAIVAYNSTFILNWEGDKSEDGTVPWTTWGRKCHMLPGKSYTNATCVYGLRVADMTNLDSQGNYFRIWDFSRRGTQMHSARITKSLRGTTGLQPDEIFCGMPLRQVVSMTFAQQDSGNPYMDEDQIYMITMKGPSKCLLIDVTGFVYSESS